MIQVYLIFPLWIKRYKNLSQQHSLLLFDTRSYESERNPGTTARRSGYKSLQLITNQCTRIQGKELARTDDNKHPYGIPRERKRKLARDLEVARAREYTTLDEMSLMLSSAQLVEDKAAQAETRAKLVEERAAQVETKLENSLEQVTDLTLCSIGLERTIENLKEKITEEETSLPKQRRCWE